MTKNGDKLRVSNLNLSRNVKTYQSSAFRLAGAGLFIIDVADIIE